MYKNFRGGMIMMSQFKWVVPDVLAVYRMPREEEIEVISSLFRCVVILAEDHELRYDPDELIERGVKVVHKPVKDFDAPDLISLYEIVKEIESCEKPVLTHCFGGRGRSGTIAVAYLMTSQSLDYKKALKKARKIDPGFVETEEQHRILRLYDRLLKSVSQKLLSKTIEIGRSIALSSGERCKDFGRGVGHASKVLELSIELVDELEKKKITKLSLETERALYTASILHDVGICRLSYEEPADMHRIYSQKIIEEHKEELDKACECSIGEKTALIAGSHGNKDPLPQDIDKETKTAIGIIRVADGLDYGLDQSIKRLKIYRRRNKLILKVECEGEEELCEINIKRAEKKKSLLEEILGKTLLVERS
jgi:protein-tyrosine phosphatase